MKTLVYRWTTEAGLDACILFVNDSHHCGYVVPPESIQGLHYDQYGCDVHGGLTFGGTMEDLGGNHAVGFDCAHCGDKTKYSSDGVFRDAAYVQDQCEKLAKQLVALSNQTLLLE